MATVYILESLSEPGKHYTGFSEDVESRLAQHNSGQVAATKEHRPWKLRASIWIEDRKQVEALERYLKSGSGRAFARKHL